MVRFGKGLLYVFCSVYQCLIINTVVVFCFLYCSYSEIKVDCITVNTIPIKSFIDDLIQRLFDALLTSLRKSISADVTTIDTFVSEAIDTLSTRPQTVEEIGEASGKHAEFSKKKKEVWLLWLVPQSICTCKFMLSSRNYALSLNLSCILTKGVDYASPCSLAWIPGIVLKVMPAMYFFCDFRWDIYLILSNKFHTCSCIAVHMS